MQFVFPHPPKALNPNSRESRHWAIVSNARRKSRKTAAMLALKQFPTEAGNKTPAEYIASVGTPTTYRIVWNHYGHVQPDDDNVVARIKSYKDGVCDLLGINDKNLRLRGVDFVSTAHNKKTFTFIIE